VAKLKIIHSADWQLGKPFARFPDEVRIALSEARLDAIDRLGNAAVSNGAAHIVVAGDVFDNVDPGDRIVMQALARMERAPVTWWLMPGNHDHARAGGLWTRVRRNAPTSVRVVDTPEAVEMEEGAWLLPAPLEHRKTVSDPTAAMVEMATPPGALRLGIAHGSITEFGAPGESSNLIPPDRARTAGLDYLALGDWHGFLTVGDRTSYSGTPEIDRFGRDEPGSCVLVQLHSGEAPAIDRVATGRYRWISRLWNITTIEDFEREVDALRIEASLSDVLLSLKLTGVASLSDRVAIITTIGDRLAHELRHLDLDTEGLSARPTPADIAKIDVQGALGAAAESLRVCAEAAGTEGQIANAALERLYVEAMRFDTGASR
jgi:DNA repair exonuclease SbcCD nuclease subunit